ncbi:hypothetical protein M422DRAFT_243032 [Sphaerobolus stellatus SS14]|nr:hypothetical protein M422DRAFT_243032 [Sphaerobolus stellatus SS14]
MLILAYRTTTNIISGTLNELKDALGKEEVDKLTTDSKSRDGSQYHAESVQEPSRQQVLQCMQEEEAEKSSDFHADRESGARKSARLTGMVGINMGL